MRIEPVMLRIPGGHASNQATAPGASEGWTIKYLVDVIEVAISKFHLDSQRKFSPYDDVEKGL